MTIRRAIGREWRVRPAATGVRPGDAEWHRRRHADRTVVTSIVRNRGINACSALVKLGASCQRARWKTVTNRTAATRYARALLDVALKEQADLAAIEAELGDSGEPRSPSNRRRCARCC